MELIRKEWTDLTEETFDSLVDAGRIDWRCIDGKLYFHRHFLGCLRMYPKQAPGLKQETPDHTDRDALLHRMQTEGQVTAEITIKASIRPHESAQGKTVQAWLPIASDCPQQSRIEILDATPGYILGPADAPQRTIYWESTTQDHFEVTYRYLHKAVFQDPMVLTCDPVQPTFLTGEQAPHIRFTPYLRALTARVTEGCKTPLERAKAIYDYLTTHLDYRYQPAYLQLDDIADTCVRELRGDCGVMSLAFIAMCRICGIPAQWQSGLFVQPGDAGAHDWAMFYVAPYGWLWADISFGVSAHRNGEEWRRQHYFGSMDPWRMVANSVFQAPLSPPDLALRDDPCDNQMGELAVDGIGLAGWEMDHKVEVLEFNIL
ncbi:MAG: transglutaminase domain-containing protein [Firmicutes bacterium]|nr:transglutaminase domain-containing protein [Bacillota bacterium]